MTAVDIHLEVGSTRTFASAVAWPGWSRSAKSRDGEEAAIEALAAYADRYAEVVRRAGQQLPDPLELRVIERAPGTKTTDFGAPDVPAAIDAVPLTRPERDRQVDLAASPPGRCSTTSPPRPRRSCARARAAAAATATRSCATSSRPSAPTRARSA